MTTDEKFEAPQARHERDGDNTPAAPKQTPDASEQAPGKRVDEPRNVDDFNLLTLDELATLADERGVKINDDVWRAHMVTELRAHQTGARPGQG